MNQSTIAFTAVIGSVQVVARFRTERPWERGYRNKTRVYGATETLSPELTAAADEWTYPPVTAQLKTENPDEAKRLMAGYILAKRRALKDAKRKLAELLVPVSDTLDKEDLTVQGFSARAGCSCGCSPGFVMQNRLTVEGQPVDLWVERTKDTEKQEGGE